MISFAELPTTLLGLVQWAIDLIAHLSANIIRMKLPTKPTQNENDPQTIREHSKLFIHVHPRLPLLTRHPVSTTPTSNLVLHLILASLPRHLLRELSRITRAASARAAALSHPARNRDWRGWRALFTITTSSPVDLPAFEALLDDVDRSVKPILTQPTHPPNPRHTENLLLWTPHIPENMLPPARSLLTTSAAKLAASIRSAPALNAHDTSRLGLDDRADAGTHRGPRVDAVRKIPLVRTKAGGAAGWGGTVAEGGGRREGAQVRVRRCVRCAALMEDIHPKERWPAWVLQAHKECVCGGSWALVDL